MEDAELLRAVQALTEATLALNRLLEAKAAETAWLPPKEAAKQLKGVTARWLVDRCRDGRYKHGVHYVNASDGDRPHYLINVAAVRRELAKPPEKRNTVWRKV